MAAMEENLRSRKGSVYAVTLRDACLLAGCWLARSQRPIGGTVSKTRGAIARSPFSDHHFVSPEKRRVVKCVYVSLVGAPLGKQEAANATQQKIRPLLAERRRACSSRGRPDSVSADDE